MSNVGDRIGYGFCRRPGEFYGLDCRVLYIDGENTNRSERSEMFRRGIRKGDTLVLLKIGDLGAGKGLRNMRAELESRGVEVEVATPPPEAPKRMGRPLAWEPTSDEVERLRALWADVSLDGRYVVGVACEMAGENAEDAKVRERMRQRLIRRFKHRGKR